MPLMDNTSSDNLSAVPEWLPDVVRFNDYRNWHQYVEVIYECYLDDFVRTRFDVGGKPFMLRRHPQSQGKDKAFWHICGHDDGQTMPETFSRCERIRWPKAIIINRDDVSIRMWMDDHFRTANGKLRVLIWFNEEYLVVLEPRPDYVLFITAYPTEYRHTIRELNARYEAVKEVEVQF